MSRSGDCPGQPVEHGMQSVKLINPFTLFDRIQTKPSTWPWVVVLLFMLNLIFALPVIAPNLNGVGDNDEAIYIDMGRKLAGGVLPKLDQSPLTVALFMLTYIPFQESDFWFVHSCTAARFLVFGLLWFGSYSLAKQVSENFTSSIPKESFVPQ